MRGHYHLSHVAALDGIRGVAIVAVVLFHSRVMPSGFVGVDIFFVLSGFLITSLLLREYASTGTISLKQFYLRRVLRLGPALMIVLIAACVYETIYLPYPGVENIFIRSGYAVAYIANWVWAFDPAANPLGSLLPLWSLAIEEQFYILWPFILRWLLVRLALGPTALIVFLAAVGAIARRYFLAEAGAHGMRLYAGTDSHADPILFGCFLALVACQLPRDVWSALRPWIGATVPVAMVGLFGMMLLFDFKAQPLWLSSGAALFSGAIILAVTVASARLALAVLECPVLVWLGKLSYSLYLWHSIASMYLLGHDLVSSPLWLISLGLGLASASYYWIERPCLRLKDRLRSSNAREPGLVGSLAPTN